MEKDSTDIYDVKIDINSMKSLLEDGWEEEFSNKGKERYDKKKDKPSVVVSVIGNQNKGKSWILGKISGEEIPKGYACKTRGLSIIYPTIDKQNIILLDTAGFETPLVENDVYKLSKKKDELSEKEYLEEVTDLAKDRQMTEYFLQRFVLTQANILLVLVGQLTYTDQKFLNRIKKECGDKRIFIIHNLKNLEEISQVKEYIMDTLKLSLTFKLKENNMIIFDDITEEEKKKHNYIYYTEEFNDDDDDNNQVQQDIVHLIMAKDGTEAGNYYNKTTIDYIKNQIVVFVGIKKFPIEEKIKEFLFKVSKDIMEEPIDKIDKIIIEDKFIKLSAEEGKEFKLKKCLIDELGMNLFVGTKYKPKYRYFKKKNEKDNKDVFVIQFAMNGAIKNLKCRVNVAGEYYFFTISGEKDTNVNENEKLEGLSNREDGYFSFEIKVPNSQILLAEHKVKKKSKMYGLVTLEFALLDQQSESEQNVPINQ